MPDYQSFWENKSYAVVGNSARGKFPLITYRKLKERAEVFPVDASTDEIDGDRAYPDLATLPQNVDAVILEIPPEDTRDWVERAADAGIENVWIHQKCDTPEAISLAEEKGLNLFYGTCAVMYLSEGLSYHGIHKWINKLLGKY